MADFFIDCKAFIAPYLCVIFNYVFDSCVYPEPWTKGVIVSLFKKGDRYNPESYRGITLVNIIAKIFSLILRNRLNTWCEEENVFNDNQFGFCGKRSTADAIFLLHSIIRRVLSHNNKLWYIFIDYKRAFDTVDRDALWLKLIQSGCSSKIINIIKCIYTKVQSCVK